MKIRKQTFSLEQYLKMMNSESIRTDAEVQRLSGQWGVNMVNELIYTVLTNDYIPPIILGEEVTNGITKQWIIDGLQRSSTLLMFRYANTKITKKLDNYMVSYQRKVVDDNGAVVRDSKNEIVWETVEFDIRNKTYEQLPEELKDIFGQYQLDTVIHQDCDTTEISKLVKRYNNMRCMTQSQRAFTYIDVFASEIREITRNRFFLDMYNNGKKDRINGTYERVVGDMVTLCNYPEQFKKDSKAEFQWLNENATIADFEKVNNLLNRLVGTVEITAEVRKLFDGKNAHIFVAALSKYTETMKDKQFTDFFTWFVAEGKETVVDGNCWIDLDVDRGTRDSRCVYGKLDYLIALLGQFVKENQKVA